MTLPDRSRAAFLSETTLRCGSPSCGHQRRTESKRDRRRELLLALAGFRPISRRDLQTCRDRWPVTTRSGDRNGSLGEPPCAFRVSIQTCKPSPLAGSSGWAYGASLFPFTSAATPKPSSFQAAETTAFETSPSSAENIGSGTASPPSGHWPRFGSPTAYEHGMAKRNRKAWGRRSIGEVSGRLVSECLVCASALSQVDFRVPLALPVRTAMDVS